MTQELPGTEYQRFWKRLQQVGLNAYEARSYLVLLGHPRFKALELAARAQVPRQKIYEVLDSLVEKGFAQVVQERTKLFSAVEPALALPAYLGRREQSLRSELDEQSRQAHALVDDLSATYSSLTGGRGTLDYLRIVSDPAQTATQYRRMLTEAQREYLEFSRPPYAVDPLDEQLVREARERGVVIKLLIEAGSTEEDHLRRLKDYQQAGVEVRQAASLPMKLAIFDQSFGLVALLDPVLTRPTWTAVVFEHQGFAEGMHALFDIHWNNAQPF